MDLLEENRSEFNVLKQCHYIYTYTDHVLVRRRPAQRRLGRQRDDPMSPSSSSRGIPSEETAARLCRERERERDDSGP